MLLAVYLVGEDHPLFGSILDYEGWPYVVGILSGVAGWVLLWRCLAKSPPEPRLYAAVMIPLVVASLVGAWRFWSEPPLNIVGGLFGLLPVGAVARWAWRGGLMESVGIAIFVVAVPVVGGSAWHLTMWKNPTGETYASDYGGREWVGNKDMFEDLGRILAPRYLRRFVLPGLLLFGVILASFWLCRLAPRAGWLGIAGAPLGSIPPVVCWWRARPSKNARAMLLGLGAVLYEAVGTVAPLLFLVGQCGWVWCAFKKP